MKFCFPWKFPTYKTSEDFADCSTFVLLLPYIFVGKESAFCDVNDVWKILAPTHLLFERNETWHRFSISVLGFGFSYSKQWGY